MFLECRRRRVELASCPPKLTSCCFFVLGTILAQPKGLNLNFLEATIDNL
jgi:hypothetical protein